MMVSSSRLIALLVALFATSVAHAELIFFDSSFTNPDFVDGGIGIGGSNPDSIIGQNGFSITNAAGNGILNKSADFGFNRALFGYNEGMDEDFVNNTATEIRVSATGLVFNNPTQQNVANFGLANVEDGSGVLGNSNLAGGVKFSWNSSDDNLYINNNNPSGFSLDTNTNVSAGESFDYEQRWIAQGGGVFNIEHYINGGGLLATTFNVTPNFNKSSLQVTGFFQDAGKPAGSFSVDGLRLSGFSSVPEPSSLGLFAVGIAAFAGRRKRR